MKHLWRVYTTRLEIPEDMRTPPVAGPEVGNAGMGYSWMKRQALDMHRMDRLAGGDPTLELLELHRCGDGRFTATPTPGAIFAPWFRDQLARNLMTQGEAARRIKRSRTTVCHWAQGLVIPSSKDQGRVRRMFERLGKAVQVADDATTRKEEDGAQDMLPG